MNFSAFHYSRAKTRLTDVGHLYPRADIVQCRQFSNILKKLHYHWLCLNVPKQLGTAPSSQIFPLSPRMYFIVLIYRCDLYFYRPSLSLNISESWIFFPLIEINKKKIPNTRHFQKDLSTNGGPFAVSMVMAAWFLWSSDEFPFDFDLFMCAASPCCHDCSLFGRTGALISLFMPCYTIHHHYQSAWAPFWIGWSHFLQPAC